MCFDTTARITGNDFGACTILEDNLERRKAFHHIHELLSGAAFDSAFKPSTGPSIKLFQIFSEG